jgi:processive 1,2-diacylglycerol beta-glucosyltransferase
LTPATDDASILPSMHGGIDTSPPQNAPLGCDLGRALVLTGSVGSGHTRAAQAVAEAMMRSGRSSDAEVVDVLAYAWPAFRALYRDAYIALIERSPGAIGWLYRSSDTCEGGGMRRALQRLALARMRQLVARERPDSIICTHFLAAELLNGMVERGEWRGTFGVVVTDLDAHALWAACPRADRWFVALPETVEILVGKGVARERIVVTGIPIMGAFSARLPSREEIRARHGMPADKPLILVSGGGVGVSRMHATIDALLGLEIECGVALVCGKNERLRAAAERAVTAAANPRVRCTVIGFTDRMHELMHAADLSVGKPGGLTSSEALAMGLPMVIMNPVPGQEERNSDHLLEWGVAIRVNSPESIRWRIGALLSDARRLRAMREAALARARPFAADAVVESLHRVALGTNPASEPAAAPATQGRTRARRAGTATTPRVKR